MNKKSGFTLLELLIVLGIMTILFMLGLASYPSTQKKARDSARIADLNNIRASLEIYRSNNSFYPIDWETLETEKYLESIPTDPYSPRQDYIYKRIPTNCNNSAILCNDFTLGAKLEIIPTNACYLTLNCGNSSCNYCVGPYGTK
ncbi:MAG: type II secretion system protein [bacterium]